MIIRLDRRYTARPSSLIPAIKGLATLPSSIIQALRADARSMP
jgi:hypothetical protein